MIASEGPRKRSEGKAIAALLLPKTRAVRLTVLGFVFGLITAMVPAYLRGLPGVIALVLFVWAFISAVRSSLREKAHRKTRLLRMLAVTAFVIVAFFAIREGEELLAFMAASGSGRITFGLLAPTQGPLNGIETFLVLASIILLIWIPQVFFSIQLDMAGTGDAQRVLLGLITTISCAMTGACFLLLHFGGGPLRSVHVGLLIVGVIGAVLLIAHPYRSLARACWQRGVIGVFDPRALKQHWDNVATELRKALDGTTDHDAKPSSRLGSAAEKTA